MSLTNETLGNISLTLNTTTTTKQAIIVDRALFYQYLALVILYSCSTGFLFDLLVRSYHSKWLMKASACFVLNIGICAVHSAFAVVFYVVFLLSLGQQKHALSLAFFGVTFVAFGFARSVSMFLLLIDRILALTVPVYYRQNNSFYVGLKALLCVVISIAYASVWIYKDWPFDEMTPCDVPLCVFRKDGGSTPSYFRTALSFLTTVFCFIFYYVVYKHVDTTTVNRNGLKNINRIIGFTVFVEIALNFTPSLIRSLSNLIDGVPFWQVIALFSDLFKVLDVVLTAFVYWLQLRRLMRKIVFVPSDR